MSSASLVDFLAEKLYSYSSKMRSDSFQPNVTSFLMNGNSTFQHYDLLNLISDTKENAVFRGGISNPFYSFMPFLRPLGILSPPHLINGMDKPDYFSSCQTENGRFSPHLFNLVSDSYRYKNCQSDLCLASLGGMHSFKESFLGESPTVNDISDKIKTCVTPVTEVKMSVNVSHSPVKKNSQAANENPKFSQSLRLNLELVNRKTKEMNKRSKKRRRRQRKNEHLNNSNSASASDEDVDNDPHVAATDSVCIIAKSPGFGCTLSVEHTVQMSPCKSSFIIPVESDSNDDSEWETFEEIELSDKNSSMSSSDSSPVKCEISESKCSTPVKFIHVSSNIMSFIVPEDSSDDDSDWDSCEIGSFPENTDFEFTGLFLTNLCAPQTFTSNNVCNSTKYEEESDEVLKMRAALLEVNKNWNELTKEDNDEPKIVTKVTFAPDENLVEVFPVEIYERKGEWEIYATERLRFKRKIDELEKVISPCLNPEHRSKIFKTLVEPEL